MRIAALTATLILSLLSLGCKGKEGPQGPPGPQGPQGPAGQDLVLPRQGFIRGTARGKDNGGNPFNISFSYSFAFSPGTWRSIDANTKEFQFERSDSLGISYLSFSFQHNSTNNSVSNVSIEGQAADISTTPVPTYNVQVLPAAPPFFPGTTQQVSSFTISGDSISGRFLYIRPSYNNIPGVGANTHPDTVEGTFGVRLVPIRSYGRTTGQ